MFTFIFGLAKILLPYWLPLVLIWVIPTLIYPKIVGKAGEFWRKKELEQLPKDKYIVLNDIMLKDAEGTHQIDHVVLSKYGIFIIEVKNYGGLIRGNEYCNYFHARYMF